MEKNIKQVIVIRKDLNMRKGKMIAQGAHASMGVLFKLGYVTSYDRPPDHFTIPLHNYALEQWIEGSFTKICVGCNSEEELLNLNKMAETEGLLSCLVQDLGKTEFDGVPTYTALAIGPDYSEKIDKITRNLKLL